MTLKIATLIFFSLFSLISQAACVVTDDAGATLHLNQPAKRIISLAPDLTEILFAIGAGNQTTGVISGSDFPPAAKQVMQVGSYTGVDLERIVSLHPDLIVTWSNTFSRQLATLSKFSIPIYHAAPRNLEDIPRTIKNFGCLTGSSVKANQLAAQFSRQLQYLRHRYARQKPVRVFYQIGDYSLITINKNSWINQVIEICGGKNIFADSSMIAPEISWEAVVTMNPDVIVSDTKNPEWKKRWESWQAISAVKNHRLFAINPDLIERAGPRILLGTRQLCEYLSTYFNNIINSQDFSVSRDN